MVVVARQKILCAGLSVLLLLAGAAAAFAQAGRPPQAQLPPRLNFKRCLTTKELETERLVRHGVYLREGSWRCDKMVSGTWTMWSGIDRDLGPRMKQVTDARKRMFDKEFRQDGDKVRTYFDGRLVTYYRNFPLTGVYCNNIDTMLKEIQGRGWGAYGKQAKRIHDNVRLDFKACN